MQTEQKQRAPRPVQIMFFFLPMKPKAESIYWSIVRVNDLLTGDEELHYAYVTFENDEFKMPVKEGFTFTMEAWCELVHPSLVLKAPEKKPEPKIKPVRLIQPASKFMPWRRN